LDSSNGGGRVLCNLLLLLQVCHVRKPWYCLLRMALGIAAGTWAMALKIPRWLGTVHGTIIFIGIFKGASD